MEYESNSKFNAIAGVGIFLVGALIIYKVHGISVIGRNENAALWLGYLLAFIGISSFLLDEKIKTSIDSQKKTITRSRKDIFSKNQEVIQFSDVERVGLFRLGKASNFTEFYFWPF